MAQLVERLVRNEEASGSNPLSSTKKKDGNTAVLFWWLIVRNAKLPALHRKNKIYSQPILNQHFPFFLL